MKPATKFLIDEIKALIKRDPPYSEKMVTRLLMCLRQTLAVLEANESTMEVMRGEIHRLENTIQQGPQRKTERNRRIVQAYKNGYSCIELGKKYFVSPQRIHAIVQMAKTKGWY